LKKVINNIFAILDRREKTMAGKLILLDVIMSVLDIAFLVMLLYIVHFYTETHHAQPHSYFPFSLFDRFPLLLIAIFFILFALKNLAGYRALSMQFRFAYAVASRLSKNNMINYLDGTYQDYVDINSSVHNRKINQQPIEFGHYVLGGFQQIISQSLLILMTIVATLVFNPVLFLLLFLILTPPILLTGLLIKKKMNAVRRIAKPVSEKTLQSLQEALSGFIESNVFGRKKFFIDRYSGYQAKFNGFLASQQVIQNIPAKLIEVFAVFGFFILILINSYTGNTSTVQLITIGAFMGAAYKIIPGIVKILNSAGQIRTYAYTAAELAEDRVQAEDRAQAKDRVQAEDQAEPTVEKMPSDDGIATIAFAGVFFSYGKEPLLNDISMVIDKGDFVGLSGTSGKGKTTLVNLLLGFAEACSGAISVNGVNTGARDRQRYWKYISYVRQQSFMIDDTVLRNIVLDEEADDPAKLDEVIRMTGLEAFTGVFPEGLNKQLKENGKNISGGQRQRIAFARALYKEADLLILDEPFSELDEVSEEKMLDHCRRLAEAGRAVLLITHSKKSLSFCNKIISLNEPAASDIAGK
jgi:ABC-type multidrug transport system fused ATPase/permease subunit